MYQQACPVVSTFVDSSKWVDNRVVPEADMGLAAAESRRQAVPNYATTGRFDGFETTVW